MWASASFTVHGSRVGGRGTRRFQSAGRSFVTRRSRIANSRRVRAMTIFLVWRIGHSPPAPSLASGDWTCQNGASSVVTVVLNNSVLGWVKDGQRRRGNRFIASELGRNDYARIAQAMGCVGVRVETIKELVGELDRVIGAKEPIVLDVVTTEDAPFWQVQSPFAKEGAGGE